MPSKTEKQARLMRADDLYWESEPVRTISVVGKDGVLLYDAYGNEIEVRRRAGFVPKEQVKPVRSVKADKRQFGE